ncbi:Oxygen sensor protein DosP [compost metagenome]
MGIVAEGVETPEQRALLTELGCDTLQGYLLGRPMPGEQLLAHSHIDEPHRDPCAGGVLA